jgi:hypothetical protein
MCFYLRELLRATNIAKSRNAFEPKDINLLNNTKREVAKLLKCLYGYELASSPTEYAIPKKPQRMKWRLYEMLLYFYLPTSLPSFYEDREFDNDTLDFFRCTKNWLYALCSLTDQFDYYWKKNKDFW